MLEIIVAAWGMHDVQSALRFFQQLEIALDDSLLMYTTAVKFRSSGGAIEPRFAITEKSLN